MIVKELLKRDNNNIDLVRIVLAAMVIVGHAYKLNRSSGLSQDFIEAFTHFEYFGSLAVKVFFIVSGLVVTNSLMQSRSAKRFLVSRFFRIIPALALVLLVTVIILGPILTTLPIHDYFNNISTWNYLGKNLIMVTQYNLPGVFETNPKGSIVNGSLWTLPFELGCYFVLLAIFMLLKDRGKYIWNLAFLLIVIESLLKNRLLIPNETNSEVYLLPASFAFGSFLAVNKETINIDASSVGSLLVLLLIFRNTPFAHLLFIFTVAVTLLLLSTTSFALKLRPKYDISYGIYVWGFLIQQILIHYLINLNVYIHILFSLLLAILFGLFSYLLVEQPGINLGRSINKKIFNTPN
jgi:peptidoglycan/LPS O-acetylase OafA/YrhL